MGNGASVASRNPAIEFAEAGMASVFAEGIRQSQRKGMDSAFGGKAQSSFPIWTSTADGGTISRFLAVFAGFVFIVCMLFALP